MSWSTLQDLLDSICTGGHSPALVYRTEVRRFVWSYRALCDGANRVASHLRQQGLRSGDRVLLWVPNSPYWAITFFGCMRAGLVVVPLDPRSQPDFIRSVQSQTEARAAFRSRFQRDPGCDVATYFVEDLDVILAQPPVPQSFPRVSPDALAEIVYTSGTTASPKGVMLTHRNLAADLTSVEGILPREPDFRFLSLLPLSHTLEQQGSLFLPLARRGEVVYIETLKPSAILEALNRESILAMVAVPRLLELLLGQIRRAVNQVPGGAGLFHMAGSQARHLPPGLRRLVFWPILRRLGGQLRYVVSGGAALPPALERTWESLGLIVLQGYGLTEAAPVVAVNLPEAHRVGSVGKPVPGVEVSIAGDGEILVRGPNVTPGYYRNHEATQTAFQDGWLRTGDLGHFDADGFLYIDGRKKEVIVTPAGVNVFPEDVEQALNREPGVRDSAVVEWQDRVFAVLLPQNPETFDPRLAVDAANRRLAPSQQIQGYDVWPFPDFPRTALLKVSRSRVRAALPQLEAGRLEAPPTGTREMLATVRQVVAQVAGVPVERVHADAALGVDLGMGSVERLELASLLEQEMNTEVEEEGLTGETRVRDVELMVREGRPQARRLRIRRWTRSLPAILLRRALWPLVLFPALQQVGRPLHVEGQENLEGLDEPAMFVANHTSQLDGPAILFALPPRFRNRIAVAAWAEFFDVPASRPLRWLVRHVLAYELGAALFNIFLVPHRRGFRASLRYAGDLVDHGWNLLVFPEGTMTRTGQMNPFQEGTGLFVSRLKVPVVPVKVEGLFEIWPPYRSFILRPGPATVKIGRPQWIRAGSYLDITQQIEDAVRML